MSVAPATTTSALVSVSGILQDPTTYSVSGTTLNFSEAPPVGTGNISVRYLGIPASGVVTTAYRTVTEFTATAGQTTFSPPSYTPGFINVFRNGVRLGATNFTATNGTSIVLANAASVGDLIVTESFLVSSVLNALSVSGGTINSVAGATPLVVQSNGVNGLVQTAAANVGVGTATPTHKLEVLGASADSVGILSLNATITSSANFNWATESFAPAMPNNSTFVHVIGKEASNGNLGYCGFRHTGVSGSNSNHLTFGTFGKDYSLNIYHGGWVTMPYQPAFYAMMNNTNITSTAAIVFEDVYVNIGSHYNPANGRFTAPVAGTYHFSANFLKRNGSGRLLFHKNDTYYGSGNSQVYAAAPVDTPLAASIIITLAVNDYITIVASIDSGDAYGNSNSHCGFSGFLIG
jgi:hypothetical protein